MRANVEATRVQKSQTVFSISQFNYALLFIIIIIIIVFQFHGRCDDDTVIWCVAPNAMYALEIIRFGQIVSFIFNILHLHLI